MSKHHHHEHHHCPHGEENLIDRLIRSCCDWDCKPDNHFTKEEALEIARVLGVNTSSPCFDLDEFWMGLNMELEHGKRNPNTNISNNDPIITGKIALAHLNEIPDYYTREVKMRREAKEDWRRFRRRF